LDDYLSELNKSDNEQSFQFIVFEHIPWESFEDLGVKNFNLSADFYNNAFIPLGYLEKIKHNKRMNPTRLCGRYDDQRIIFK